MTVGTAAGLPEERPADLVVATRQRAPMGATPPSRPVEFALADHLAAPACEGITVRSLAPLPDGAFVALVERQQDGVLSWIATGDSLDDLKILFAGHSREHGASGVWARVDGAVCRAPYSMPLEEIAGLRAKPSMPKPGDDLAHAERKASLATPAAAAGPARPEDMSFREPAAK